MHSLSTSLVLGYHGCERQTAEKLLLNEPFQFSTNDYDWLGSGIYFWETNPDRALDFAREKIDRAGRSGLASPVVVGAVIDPGYCLDLMSAAGIALVEEAHARLERGWEVGTDLGDILEELPRNVLGPDLVLRKLDCAVLNMLHLFRAENGEPPFDTVRAVFTEGEHLYEGSGFRRKTHIQICVRNPENINGVFRVPERHFRR